MIYHYLIDPFIISTMMRHALIASIALSCSGPALGVFLVARPHELGWRCAVTRAFARHRHRFRHQRHGILAAVDWRSIAGLFVITANILVKRYTWLTEDASFAGAYLISLAMGVIIITASGGSEELVHILFGDELQIKTQLLYFATGMASVTLVGLAIIYRGLITECVDSVYMKSIGARGGIYHYIFLVLVVLNLVAAFQALGTLMSLGLILLPAIAAKFWTKQIDFSILLSIIIALFSSIIGLLLMYNFHIPGGPAAVCVAGVIYIISIFLGRYGVLIKLLPHHHSED